ncbi:MAG: segregation/condensation protein A, partial [Candidatus Dadabacteria bacterium]
MAEAAGIEEYSHFFEVRLDLFSGPIDLLLHLVKQNELPIEKLSLAEVTAQYLECIETMRRYDLEVAGEYLVIAATLLSIKSSLILNEPVEMVEDEEGNLVDPHEELLRRLREAEVYQEGARKLAGYHLLGYEVFAAPSSLKRYKAAEVQFKEHDPMLLGRAFKKLLENAVPESEMEITLEAVSIVERMMDVLRILQERAGREV